MKLADVIDNLTKLLASVDKKSFVYDFLAAFGTPKATLARLKSGNLNVAKKAGCILLKGKVYFEPVIKELIKTPSPREIVELATANPQIERNKPRFLFSTDFKEFVAYDTKRKEWLEVAFKELGEHYTFFLPLAGMEKTSFQEETDADVRAAEQMAKLYDLIIADNPPSSKAERHQLNVFITRLLFCLFAEDTGIFPNQLFTNAIKSFTQSDGSDVGELLEDIFLVLNTQPASRNKIKPHLSEFPYVNGRLFSDTISKRFVVPQFTTKSRLKLIDLGGKSWKEINPDIFGSMFQGVVDAEVRADLGMHYTSVPNIMKVIKPLFLDDLCEEFGKAKGSEGKLNSLLKRIYRLRIFDPACGSGNFLIIAYKELRRLEMAIFKDLQALTTQLPLSGIHVSQFYGIEIDDFAHEVAILAMWLVEHQMNVEFKIEFGDAPASLPLREGAKIACGNATALDWEKVCSCSDGHSVFILGNPPYLGSRYQTTSHKEDIARVFLGEKNFKQLDYISCWFQLAARYIEKSNSDACFAFVSTNSICQGELVAALWTRILNRGLEIRFAYTSFRWSNSAKSTAAVICVIVGIGRSSTKTKFLFQDGVRQSCERISPTLTTGATSVVVPRQDRLSHLPKMVSGNKAVDGGHLFLTKAEKETFEALFPSSEKFIRRVWGAKEFLQSTQRWCLWIEDDAVEEALKIKPIAERVERVRESRLSSPDQGANALATTPHRFREMLKPKKTLVLMPTVSSEQREYIPVGFFGAKDVVIAPNQAIYDAPSWVFGAISSKMHMVWVKAVAGRLKTDIRYSSSLCYNNFPLPELSEPYKELIGTCAETILLEREKHPEKTISYLYDPKRMPPSLLEAHRRLDGVIDLCYRAKPFLSDEERLSVLYALYRKMTGGQAKETDQQVLLEV